MTSTLGNQLRNSPQINQLLDGLVEQTLAIGSRIQGVKPADASAQAESDDQIKKLGESRGRPLYYNYLGSGVGRGPYVELQDGSIKMDLINGIGIHLFGHSHPRVVRATLKGSLADILQQGNLQPNTEYLQLNQKLVELAVRSGSNLKYAWLATCGTMANENALKIARQKKKGARMIISFKNAFAGRSTMMAEVTDNAAYKVNLPEYGEVLRLPFYDPAAPKDKTLNALKEHVAKHGADKIGCFVFEPMLGEGGYRAANHEFFVPLLDFCKAQNIPVWADEIQTFTRTGNYFAFETYDIAKYIDLCTIAKTAQVGATFYTEDFKPDAGLLGGTFSGSTPALTAGLEIMNMLEDGYMGPNGKIMKIHKEFVGMLNELNETTCKGLLREAGGLGLMVAVTALDGSKDKQGALLKSLFKNGLICFGCGSDPYRVRFLLPAILTGDDIKAAKKIIEQSVRELA